MKESIILGAIITIFGVFLITIQNSATLIYGLVLTALGIALIIFNKAETQIEQRKDIKTKTTKK